jgi:putative ABC transport system permease protein
MITLKTALFVAYKTITQGSKSTGILLVSILGFSFLNILFISGILGGLGQTIKDSIIDTSSGHVQIKPQEEPTNKQYIESQAQIRSQVETIPGIVGTARRYSMTGTLSYDREKNGKYKDIGGTIYGIDVGTEDDVFITSTKVTDGRFLSGDVNDEIVIGSGIAGGSTGPSDIDFGGVSIGDKIIVTYPSGQRTYTIVGVVTVGIGPGNQGAYVTSKEAESVLSQDDAASTISIRTDLDTHPLEYYLEKVRNLFPKLVVKSYSELMADIGTLLTAFNLISVFVSAIAILVAMITMFALVYVNAASKRKQIGILRAIGLRPEIIVYSYIFQSLFYTACGVIVGSILVFGLLQPYLLANPIQLPFGGTALVLTTTQIMIAVGSLFVAGVLGGFVPARIVTKQKILNAIWG